jgi:hypothetical protein
MLYLTYGFKELLKIFSKANPLCLQIVVVAVFLFSLLPLSVENNDIMALFSVHALNASSSLPLPVATTTANLLSSRDDIFVKVAVGTSAPPHLSSSDSSNSSTNNKYIPFTSNFTLPPRIVMVYNGIQHPGVLVSYKYRHGYTFGQLDMPAEKITALLPSDVVNIKKGSSVRFFAKGDPAVLPPSSLSIDAYTSRGKAAGVLNVTKSESTTFALNLNEGKYILLAVATWLPRSEDVTGYTIFSYMVNVVPP